VVIRSLYLKVLAVLMVLTVTLVVQFLVSRDGFVTLFNGQQAITLSYEDVNLVYELERDVIDLQRNLLIYKDTASDDSSARFHSLMNSVEGKLNVFLDISKSHKNKLSQKTISRMAQHLADYQESFKGVVSGIKKHSELVNSIKAVTDDITKLSESSLGRADFLDFKNRIEQSKNAMHQYLNSPDSDHINKFKDNVLHAILLLKTKDNKNLKSIKLIKSYKKLFLRLTHVTRGYVFLVKVVMAGSANEFLFLAKEIRKTVTQNQLKLISNVRANGKNIQEIYQYSSGIMFAIVMMMAWLLIKLILLPIKSITDVFRVLARGGEVSKIPGADRRDEIGALAKAAEVFHTKNKQTHDLLEQSQDMIATQGVLNLQLEAEKDKAEQAAESKSMFLANMSHEIRTPMNGIVGLVDLLLKTEVNDKQKDYLNRVAYSGEIMMNVINDILDFSKIEAGKMDIESIEFEINSVIENLISSIIVKLEDKALNLRVTVDNNVPKTLMGDPLRISQILLNLCNNAVKFTDNGFIEVNFSYPSQSIGRLHIEVLDTGIGMNDDQINKIFNSFTQADGSTSRKYGGTGLGLSIVKQLVLLMGGDIKVSSKTGEGASVNVEVEAPSVGEEKALTRVHSDFNDLLVVADIDCHKMIDIFLSNVSATKHVISPQEYADYPFDGGAILLRSSFIREIVNYQDIIKGLIEKGCPVGFLLESSEKHLKNDLLEKMQSNVLVHPFSANQCNNFLSDLLTVRALEKEDVSGVQKEEKISFTGHILLVEDNEINQLVAGDMLETMGVSYEVVSDGQQALNKIVSGTMYDLVLMDVQMPIMDGYTATRAIRKAGFDKLSICGLSANALKEDFTRAKDAGMNDYLTKPLQLLDMEGMLKKYLIQA
jgi:signal transduction histidine kinase/CheY-like chemotaxis protein